MFKTQFFCNQRNIYIYIITYIYTYIYNPIKPPKPQQLILPDWIKPSASTVRQTCGTSLDPMGFPTQNVELFTVLPKLRKCTSSHYSNDHHQHADQIRWSPLLRSSHMTDKCWPMLVCHSPEKLTAGDMRWICRIIYMLHISKHIWHTGHTHIDLIPPPHLVKNRLEHSCPCNRARTTYPSTP